MLKTRLNPNARLWAGVTAMCAGAGLCCFLFAKHLAAGQCSEMAAIVITLCGYALCVAFWTVYLVDGIWLKVASIVLVIFLLIASLFVDFNLCTIALAKS